jgi:two-component system, chemotaxis family, protein-glutamate methylesterase/glutaminase
MSTKVRVMVVDDSPLVRQVLTRCLQSQGDIEVVAQASDAYVARDLLMKTNPDVLTLDIEMPRMDGLTFLKKVMHYRPMPVIIVSTLSGPHTAQTLEALAHGAFEAVEKPTSPDALAALSDTLCAIVREAARSTAAKATRPVPAAAPPEAPSAGPRPDLIAIGASTGGTVAIEKLLLSLEAAVVPPIVISQHMPAGFTAAYANRINKLSPLDVREAVGGEVLVDGLVLIAPGGKHLTVERVNGQLRSRLLKTPTVNGHAPSVDVMFDSVAEVVGPRAFGALLTGMGKDGAAGLLAMRKRDALTIAQDEASCVVFGMPKAAIDLQAAVSVWPLDRIGQRIRLYARGAQPRAVTK